MTALIEKTEAESDAKCAELFAANPTCGQCDLPIATIEEATAVYFPIRAAWKLVHREFCAFDSLFQIPRFGGGPVANSLPGVVRSRRS